VILVDTNIFVDLWTADLRWHEWSAEALAQAAEKGPVGVNPIIYSERHRSPTSSSAPMPKSKSWPS